MAELWTILIAAVALALIGAVVLPRWQQMSSGATIGLLVGAAAGIAGAAIIIGPRLDMVPDDLERLGIALLVMLGSLGLIIATWLRSLRR